MRLPRRAVWCYAAYEGSKWLAMENVSDGGGGENGVAGSRRGAGNRRWGAGGRYRGWALVERFTEVEPAWIEALSGESIHPVVAEYPPDRPMARETTRDRGALRCAHLTSTMR